MTCEFQAKIGNLDEKENNPCIVFIPPYPLSLIRPRKILFIYQNVSKLFD